MPQQGATRKNTRWIARHYGSRAGFLCTFWHRILYLFGRYRKYHQVDWSSVERLVFICKGNICRSAFAEAVAGSLGIETVSCGLDTIENAPANRDAILMANKLGFDLEQHVTRPVMYMILRKTDLLIAMEPWQIEFLERNLSRKHQCTLLGLWSRPVLPHIHDPYGSSQAYFGKCFERIQNSIYEIEKEIRKTARG